MDLQDKIPKLEGQIFDLEDQLEELGSKVEDQIQDLLDKMKYSETPVTSAPQPTTYGKGSLELLEATADYQRSGYSYPKEALLDGVLETNQDKKAASGSGYGGYCYVSSQSVASSGQPVVKLGVDQKIKVDRVRLLMRYSPPWDLDRNTDWGSFVQF